MTECEIYSSPEKVKAEYIASELSKIFTQTSTFYPDQELVVNTFEVTSHYYQSSDTTYYMVIWHNLIMHGGDQDYVRHCGYMQGYTACLSRIYDEKL
jgi:hypothetical protein